MPLAWLHAMSKQQLEELASQLGLETGGALDDLRKRVKEKWTAIEPFLPSSSMAAKSPLVSKTESPGTELLSQDSSYSCKMKIKLVVDALKNVPFLADTDPENVLKFLMAVKGVYDLHLVTDFELISLLVARTSGRTTSILGAHLNSTRDWGMVRSEIVNTFLPPRVKERYLSLYVLDRFQSPSEDINGYIMAVVAAAEILGFEGGESRLVHRIIQNLHPRVKGHLLFTARPESVKDLYALATTVAEGMAVEEQRKSLAATSRSGGASGTIPNSMVVTGSARGGVDSRVSCWRCGEGGHFRRDCPLGQTSRNPAVSGNALGARE